MKMPLIAMLSDFGDTDPFVGIMKGVILKQAPGVQLVDITHNIPPGDILRAAVTLWQTTPYFPSGTVFLCVVDPGVGSERRAMIAEEGENIYIGPDNGLFTFAFQHPDPVHVIGSGAIEGVGTSTTFHGRDIFAPGAAAAARGQLPAEFGPAINDWISLERPRFTHPSSNKFEGEILYPDHFGNLLTSIGRFQKQGDEFYYLPWLYDDQPETIPIRSPQISIRDHPPIQLVRTFADIPSGEVAGLIGSTGLLEISAKGENATELTGLTRGDRVEFDI